MSKPVYKEAYKEYVEYCKKHNKEPLALRSLHCIIYKIEGSWKLIAEEKVEIWYKKELFKTRIDNKEFRWQKEKEYYDNYKGEKIKYYPYINAIRRGYTKEEAIKRKIGNKSKYYRDNIDKAKVELQTFISRTNLGWSFQKSLTTPKMQPGKKVKKDLKKSKKRLEK